MKKDEFLEEMHNYIDNSYSDFIKKREILHEIFKEFHRICKKNSVDYTLAFGSLLGVVRDDDIMPPWDRDIDVVVPYNQIKKLIDALKKDLSDDFYFDTNFINKKFPFYQLLVGKKGYDIHTFHVDVFYLLDVSDVEKIQNKTKTRIKKLFWERAYKYGVIYNENNKIKFIAKKIRKLIYNINCNLVLNLKFTKLSQPIKGSSNYIVMDSGAEIFPKNIFNKKKKIEINGIEVFILEDYDKLLTILYGDYKSYLPIHNRFEEFYIGIQKFRNK